MKKNLLLFIFFLNLSYQSKGQASDTLCVSVYGAGGGTFYCFNNVVAESGGDCNMTGHPTGPAIMVAIIDSCTFQPWSNLNTNHGQWNLYWAFPNPTDTFVCRTRPENYFVYSFNDPLSFTALHEWLRDSVPNGNYVLIYSWTTYSWSNAPAELNNLMTDLACSSWPPQDSVPFIFVTDKGHSNILDTLVQGNSSGDSISLTVVLYNSTCPVGISEITQTGNEIIISPNPAHDEFTINHNGELKIYDAMGRKVKEQTIINPKSELINLSLTKGIYFVRVGDKEKVFMQKLVVE